MQDLTNNLSRNKVIKILRIRLKRKFSSKNLRL